MKKDCGETDDSGGTTWTATGQGTFVWSKGSFVWELQAAGWRIATQMGQSE
jgi:hypothetical protein